MILTLLPFLFVLAIAIGIAVFVVALVSRIVRGNRRRPDGYRGGNLGGGYADSSDSGGSWPAVLAVNALADDSAPPLPAVIDGGVPAVPAEASGGWSPPADVTPPSQDAFSGSLGCDVGSSGCDTGSAGGGCDSGGGGGGGGGCD